MVVGLLVKNHEYFKGHTGYMMSLGKGSVHIFQKTQNFDTRRSTESELVGKYYSLLLVLW